MLRCLPCLLVLAGCAARLPPPAPAASGVSRAVIVAVRAIAPSSDILALLGVPSSPLPGAAREFILRTEDGRIVSIVQEDDGALRVGQAVSVVAGDRSCLVGS